MLLKSHFENNSRKRSNNRVNNLLFGVERWSRLLLCVLPLARHQLLCALSGWKPTYKTWYVVALRSSEVSTVYLQVLKPHWHWKQWVGCAGANDCATAVNFLRHIRKILFHLNKCYYLKPLDSHSNARRYSSWLYYYW